MRRNTGGESLRRAPLTVMMIDPDTDGARLLAGQLAGAQTMVLGSSTEATRVLNMQVPDLIVTELDLSDGDGLRFLRAVHTDERTRHVLLVVITRRNSIQDKIAAFQAGADDYLVKPVDGQRFVTHIRMVSKFRRTLG